MEEEIKTVETETPMSADDYLANLNALKKDTVPKEEYDRVLADRKKLADALANGNPYSATKEEPKPDIDALRQKFLGKYKNDNEMLQDMLTLRKLTMEAGNPDPIAGRNPDNLNPTNLAEYERISEIIQDALDASNGSNAMFMAELRRRCTPVR